MKNLKSFIMEHKHCWTLLYAFIYMPWFFLLEKIYTADYPDLHILHCSLDDKIPFIEWFIIPYLLWFVYVAVVFIYTLLTSKYEFYRLSAYAFTGMTIALLICTIYPNGVNLRLDEFTRDNILVSITQFLYTADTSTNVFPSLHVFVTIVCHITLMKSDHLKQNKHRKWILVASTILSILILLSTLYLKQHSVIDLIGGVIMSIILYLVAYKWWFKRK